MNLFRTVAVASGVAFVAFAGSADAQDKVKLLYTPVGSFEAAYVAADQGFFKNHGIDVEFTATPLAGNVAAVIESGAADVGGPTMLPILQGNENGLDLVVLAGGSVYPLPGDGLVARIGSGIEKATDLKGKTVGVPGFGTILHVLLRRALAQRGVDPDSVKFVELGFPQAADAMKSQQIDAYTEVEPFTERIVKAGIGKLLPDWPTPPDGTLTIVFASTRQWATQHRQDVEALRAGMRDAVAFIPGHRDETDQSIATYTKLPVEVVKSMPADQISVDISIQQVQFWIDLAREQKLITGNPDPKSILFE